MSFEYDRLQKELERLRQELNSVSWELEDLKREKHSVKQQVEVLKEAKDAVWNGVDRLLRHQEMSTSVRTRRRIRPAQTFETFQEHGGSGTTVDN